MSTGALSIRPAPLLVTRRLSVDGTPLVTAGQWVDAETPLISMNTFPGRILRTQASTQLRSAPTDTESCLIAPPGTPVAAGEVIARSSLFWNHRLARAAHDGSVAGVSPSLGVVFVREQLPTHIAETVRINIVEQLGADKNYFSQYVRVRAGDHVERGQLVATKQVGHQFQNIFSPVFGTVTNVVPQMGSFSIVPDQISSVVTAHLPGVVTAVRGCREVDVAGYGVAFDGLIGVGGEAHGPLVIAANEAAAWRPRAGQDLGGAVLVTGTVDLESLRAAAACGVTALVAGRARQSTVCGFVGHELGVIATGDEDVPLVLVLTEGFGTGAMSPRLHEALSNLAGKTCSISGTTHIRAGVIRPRLLVSFEAPADLMTLAAGSGPGAAANQIGLVETATELRAGLRARILRGPRAGQSVVIERLHERQQTLPTGAQALVATVLLADIAASGDDSRVIVAQSNLKLEGGGDTGE